MGYKRTLKLLENKRSKLHGKGCAVQFWQASLYSVF